MTEREKKELYERMADFSLIGGMAVCVLATAIVLVLGVLYK